MTSHNPQLVADLISIFQSSPGVYVSALRMRCKHLARQRGEELTDAEVKTIAAEVGFELKVKGVRVIGGTK